MGFIAIIDELCDESCGGSELCSDLVDGVDNIDQDK